MGALNCTLKNSYNGTFYVPHICHTKINDAHRGKRCQRGQGNEKRIMLRNQTCTRSPGSFLRLCWAGVHMAWTDEGSQWVPRASPWVGRSHDREENKRARPGRQGHGGKCPSSPSTSSLCPECETDTWWPQNWPHRGLWRNRYVPPHYSNCSESGQRVGKWTRHSEQRRKETWGVQMTQVQSHPKKFV